LETRQFRIDETDNVVLDGIVDADMSAEMADAETGETQEDSGTDVDMGREKKSKKPGKLPNRPRSDSTDSKNAATDMLRKFFNRR
jgi:hypothetical protein